MKIEHVLASKGMNVVTIGPAQSLTEAIAQLAMHNIGALVVMDEGGAPVGILSERDIVRELARNRDLSNRTVGQLMTPGIVTGSSGDDVKSALEVMVQKHFRHLPILDQGQLVGIVSLGDVVNAQLNEYEGEIETLETEKMEGEER